MVAVLRAPLLRRATLRGECRTADTPNDSPGYRPEPCLGRPYPRLEIQNEESPWERSIRVLIEGEALASVFSQLNEVGPVVHLDACLEQGGDLTTGPVVTFEHLLDIF